MVYQPLDDRPGSCEGCGTADYPSQFGVSVKQITWNNVLGLWLCIDCLYSWSNWMGTDYPSDAMRKAKKPVFLTALERERK